MRHRSLFVVAAVAGLAAATSQAQIVDTSFTYQGQLQEAGVNYNGSADFVFRLWDAPVGGNFLGDEVVGPVAVSNGLFSTELDFGAAAIDAPNGYLEIFVRTPAGGGSYTALGTRQKLNAAPYSIQSRGWFTNDAGDSSLTNPATGQGMYFFPDPAFAEPYMQVLDDSGMLLNEIIQASGGGIYRAFENTTSQLGAAFGAGGFIAGVGGFLELDDSDGSYDPLVRIYADQDFNNTDTDADAIIRLQSNGGAGTIGSQVTMENGAGFFETIQLDAGASGSGGQIRVGDESGTPTINLNGGNDFGTIQTFADDGTQLFTVQEDPSIGPFSGSMYLGGQQGIATVVLESDFGASGDPFMQLNGSTRDVSFRTDVAGDFTAQLPTDAINQFETSAEAGIASVVTTGQVVPTGGVETNITSRSLTCPTSGFVLVIATAELTRSHTTGTTSAFSFGVSDESGVTPGGSQDVDWVIPSGAPSGTRDTPGAAHGVFNVSAGLNTFYLVGDNNAGTGNVTANDVTMTCLFVPTAYGVVNPALRESGMNDEQMAAMATPLTDEDILIEQLMAQQQHIDRLASELATYQAQQQQMMEAIERLNPAAPGAQPTPMRSFEHQDGKFAAEAGR